MPSEEVQAPRRGFLTSAATARELPAAGGHLLAGAADTAGAFTAIRSSAPPGDSTPLHRHVDMDESFYVIGGDFTVTCGDDVFEASAGDFVHLPRGLPHKLVAGPDGGEMLVLGHPGGLDGFFAEWAAGADDAAAVGARHGIEFLE